LNPPDDPVFEAPWQAEAFAIVVALHERGLFTWPQWAEALGAEVASGDPYYDCWLRALEKMLRSRSVATAAEIEALTAAWHRAAHATPHGRPILLENDPEHRASGDT
jgi:nitrile hydratase accessory protein